MHSPELRLHSAARTHAAKAYAEWSAFYVNSVASGRPDSRESYGIFPRYLVLDAIHTAIERLDAERLPGLAATRSHLIEAVSNAHSSMTDNVAGNAIAQKAMTE